MAHIKKIDQMPSFKMKTNLNMSSIRETNCLSVCQKSNVISKKSYSHVSVSQQHAEFDKCVQKCQDGYGKQLIPLELHLC